MEDLGSLWTYQENIEELKYKLLCTTVELDSVKMEAKEQMRKSEEYVKSLFDLLKTAQKERDEARDQLQRHLNKIMLSNPTDQFPNNILPLSSPESPLLLPAAANKANSSITESSSLSENYNHHSHNSSPVESLFDAVSSPEFSNINVADSGHMGFANQPFVQDYNAAKIDHVIDNLAKGKTLPRQGKLLQAVMEAGPLLQTLLVAGPLPRWRNPPPLQPFKIPPVAIKGTETAENSCFVAQRGLNSMPYSQTCSASMLNFGGAGGSSTACFNNSRLLTTSSSSFKDQFLIPTGKRQRLH